jgi:hypothetical protein
MPIETPKPPQDAIEAVRASIARRAPRQRGLRGRLRARAPAASVSAPQRVFTVGLDALAGASKIEDSARATGWRFLVEEAREPVAAAEVHDETGATVPAQVTEGQFVRSTAEGLRAAEAHPAVGEATFELRTLRVPALNLVALWLHSPEADDLFVPLEPAPAPLEAGHPYAEGDFTKLSTALAAESLERHHAAESPDELGA